MTDETDLTPREVAAGRLLAFDALGKLMSAQRETLRSEAGALFREGSSDSAELNGVDLGTVSRPKAKLEWAVRDRDAFLAWVKVNHPDQVLTETTVVEKVAPGFEAELLKIVKAGTGEFIDGDGVVGKAPPGVVLQRKPGALTVRTSKDAQAAVAEALGPVVVAALGLRELES